MLIQADDEYMISDYDLLVNKYISVPKTYSSFNPGSLVAGNARRVLDGAGFAARSGTLMHAWRLIPLPHT